MARTIALSGRDWKICGMLPHEWVWKAVWDKPFAAYPAYWVPAEVPGSVQLDMMEAGVLPDWVHDLDSRACEWTSYRDWVHVRQFPTPDLAADETAWLRIGGVDWLGHVYLNGQKLGEAEGMWQAREWNVSGVLRQGEDNLLVVVVEHAPEQEGQIGWTDQARIWKPRFAYDWDWCTRLIPLGIFGDVDLVLRRGAWIDDVWARPQVAADLQSAQMPVVVELQAASAGEAVVAVTLEYEGRTIAQGEQSVSLRPGGAKVEMALDVDSPSLWRPNRGTDEAQPLYTCRTEVKDGGEDLDRRDLQMGFRHIEAQRTAGAPESALPYQLVVNGEKVFIHGSNWAPTHQLYGRRWAARYERWIDLARRANYNLLRVWGGGLLEREEFYRACDRAGIMVWQEFLQSSSGVTNYPAVTRDYLAYVEDQATALVRSRRNHASLTFWTGGNELIGADNKPLDDNYPVLHLLREVVKREDPDRLYLATSPTGPVCGPDPDFKGAAGDVHGHWRFLGDGKHQDFYGRAEYMLHSEFGTEGAANIETLRACISEDKLWPPDATNPIWVHHGEWWINRKEVEDLFGPTQDIESFVKASQWLHAETLRWLLEEDRRKAPRCAGTMNWQYNETFPNTSCTNVLDFYGEPKPVYYAMRDAYSPSMVTVRAMRMGWHGEKAFEADLWATVDFPRPGGSEVSGAWRITDAAGKELAEERFSGRVAEAGSAQIGTIRWAIPDGYEGLFFVTVSGQVDSEDLPRPAVYMFSTWAEPAFAGVWEMPRAYLSLEPEVGEADEGSRGVVVRNMGEAWAVGVRLRTEEPGLAKWSDAYLNLVPDEAATVTVAADFAAPVKVIAEGINTSATEAFLG